MMKNIYRISYYTYREALSRKIFIAFSAISLIVLIITALILFSADISFTGNIKVNGKFVGFLSFLKMSIIMPLYAGGLFLSIFSASSFIPSMLEKGNIEILLSKPIARSQIIIGKFFGGVFIVLVNIAFLVAGLWLIIGFRFSVWDLNLLWTIPAITFAFSVLYSMIILIGIATQSSTAAMMLSYLIFFVLSPILSAKETVYSFINNKFLESIVNILYYIIPQTSEIGSITSSVASGTEIDSLMPIYISLLFIILIISFSIFIFNKKDY